MKKILIAITILFTVAANAFAGEEIKPEVLDAFKNKFTCAKEVTWEAGSNYYKAAFNYNGNWLFAYFSKTGGLIGLTRNISSTQLPMYLQSSLQKKYDDFWITGLVEESNAKGFNYYITIRDADQKIVLKSKNGGDWEIYSKQQKL